MNSRGDCVTPSYYVVGKVPESLAGQEMDLTELSRIWNPTYHVAQVLKYLLRAGRKTSEDELRDLGKAVYYCNRWFEYRKKKLIKRSDPEKKEEEDPIHPSYYRKGKIEPIDYIEDQELSDHLGSCVKYISRAGYKSSNERLKDLKKARDDLEEEIYREEHKNET